GSCGCSSPFLRRSIVDSWLVDDVTASRDFDDGDSPLPRSACLFYCCSGRTSTALSNPDSRIHNPASMDRYLVSFDTKYISHETVDVLVTGTGVAGLTAAIIAARGGAATLMVNKSGLEESNTTWAKGGIAAVVAPADSFESHVQDTLVAGDGLCEEAAVRAIVEGGPRGIAFLESCGAKFDRADGGLELGREGGHSGNRIIHAGGDATGEEVSRALLAEGLKT